MNPAQRFCGHCGTPLPATVRFCTQCGEAVTTDSLNTGAENVTGTVTGLMIQNLVGGPTYYALLPTPSRVLVAIITQQMLQVEYEKSAQAAKADGSGFFGQVFAKMGAAFDIWASLRSAATVFRTIPPDQILATYPASFAIPRAGIVSVTLTRHDRPRNIQKSGLRPAHVEHNYTYKLQIVTREKTLEYDAPYFADFREELLAAFPGMVTEKVAG